MHLAGVPASCDKEWSFQGVVNHFLPGFNTKTIQAKTKQDCLNACLNEEEFQCYSAEMRYDNLTCALSNVSQTTLQTKLQKVNEGQRIDYFENNCAKGQLPSQPYLYLQVDDHLRQFSKFSHFTHLSHQ